MKARCTTGDWRAMLDDSNEPVTSEDDIDVSRSSDRVWLEVAILTSAPDAPHEGPADAGEPLDLSARIAIVARDPELRAYIRDCLGATAFRLIEAADLASAASADGRPIADLLILDLSGLDAAEREQLAQSAFARLPLVLITDEPLGPRPPADHPPHAVAFIAQPFNARQLRAEVRRCLDCRDSS